MKILLPSYWGRQLLTSVEVNCTIPRYPVGEYQALNPRKRGGNLLDRNCTKTAHGLALLGERTGNHGPTLETRRETQWDAGGTPTEGTL